MQAIPLEINPILAKELKNELSIIKHDALKLSLLVFIQLKELVVQFLKSYNDYSYTNIKTYGLGEILWRRALRFFKIELDQEEEKTQNDNDPRGEDRGTWKERVLRLGKTILRFLLYPLYLILKSISFIYKEKPEKKSVEPVRRNKNVYIIKNAD